MSSATTWTTLYDVIRQVTPNEFFLSDNHCIVSAIDGKPAPASNFLRPLSSAAEEGFEAGQLLELFDGGEGDGGLCRVAKVINVDKSLVRDGLELDTVDYCIL